VYNFFNNKFGSWVRVGGNIMHVIDIGGHLALGYTYQIWFGTRPTKECFFFFLIKKKKWEPRVLKCEDLGPELDRRFYQKNLNPWILEFFKEKLKEFRKF